MLGRSACYSPFVDWKTEACVKSSFLPNSHQFLTLLPPTYFSDHPLNHL